MTDRGTVRAINEDCFVVDERLRCAVVADGMGGHNAGEVASHMTVEIVTAQIRRASGGGDAAWPYGFDDRLSTTGNVLRTSVILANAQVLEKSSRDPELSGMGTTVVAAVMTDGHLSIAQVGDTRLYLFSDGRLQLLTHDDSWVADVLANDPHADIAALANHPMRNALTNVVGAEAQIEVHVIEQPLADGARIVITTDGVHGVLDDRWIEQRLAEGGGLDQIAVALVDAAITRGSRDNCTAVLGEYKKD